MKKFISIGCAIILICVLSVTGFAAHYVGGSCTGYATNGRVGFSTANYKAYAKTYCVRNGAYKEITNFQGELNLSGGGSLPFGPMSKKYQESGTEVSQYSTSTGSGAERLAAIHRVQTLGETWVGGTY